MDNKKASGTDTLDFAQKTDLAGLKSELDDLDIDKLKEVEVLNEVKKFSNIVEKGVVKKTGHNQLVTKVNTSPW